VTLAVCFNIAPEKHYYIHLILTAQFPFNSGSCMVKFSFYDVISEWNYLLTLIETRGGRHITFIVV